MASKHHKRDKAGKKERTKNGSENRIEKLQQRLAKAQVKLHEAQERRTQAISKGEQDLEKTRQKVAQRVSRATAEVERRVAAVSRAESELIQLTAQAANGVRPSRAQATQAAVLQSVGQNSPTPMEHVQTPEQVADVLAHEEAQADGASAVDNFPTPQNVVATLESIESQHPSVNDGGYVPIEGEDQQGRDLYVPPGAEENARHDHDWHS